MLFEQYEQLLRTVQDAWTGQYDVDHFRKVEIHLPFSLCLAQAHRSPTLVNAGWMDVGAAFVSGGSDQSCGQEAQ
jgi:hypothetical protein